MAESFKIIGKVEPGTRFVNYKDTIYIVSPNEPLKYIFAGKILEVPLTDNVQKNIEVYCNG